MHLTEHQCDVPGLLPTQGNNVSFTNKVTQNADKLREKRTEFLKM